MPHIDPLEAWLDESIRRSEARGYYPREFKSMRQQYGTVKAMERLMQEGKIQSGLIRLKKLGMAEEWSIEAGILKFPARFSRAAQDAARFRLEHIDDKRLR